MFITGTDTGIGKTFVSCAWVRALRQRGVAAVGYKPFACGDRDDALLLREAADGCRSVDEINPVWLKTPAAPLMAARVEKQTIDVQSIIAHVKRCVAEDPFSIVEGVGGWRVPITESCDVSDFAYELGLPVVIVAANRLGVLNHLQLTAESVRQRGCLLEGVILNRVDTICDEVLCHFNRKIIEEDFKLPVLAEVGFGGDLSGSSKILRYPGTRIG